MLKVDLEKVFCDLFDVDKQHIPDSDHIAMCMDRLRSLDDYGYDLNTLKGHDEMVDEALEELFPTMIDEDEEHNEDY